MKYVGEEGVWRWEFWRREVGGGSLEEGVSEFEVWSLKSGD